MTGRSLAVVVGLVAASVLAPAAPAAQGNDRATALVGLARVRRDAGDLAAARGYFEQALAIGPLQPTVLTEYFWLIADGDHSRAFDTGRQILLTIPAMAQVRDRTITAAIALKREADVIELAETGRRVHPQAALWPRRLAESYLRQGRPADAAEAYRTAAGSTGREPTDQIGLAVALEAADRATEAVAAWSAVPEAAWIGRTDWVASRFRALAKGAPPNLAASELEAWLGTHPNDRDARVLLVELHARSGRPDLALRAIGQLAAGPAGEAWARREVDLAIGAGNTARAISRLESLIRERRGSPDDHWRLVDLLLQTKRHDRARTLIDQLGTPATGCSDRLFGLAERLPEPAATDLMLKLVTGQRCPNDAIWSTRAIERAVATERHAEALSALQTWPEGSRLRLQVTHLEGQLLLWTGHPVRAVPVLAWALRDRPDDVATRVALVEAYRATGQSASAWTAAEPLLALGTLASDRLMLIAQIALEAGRAERVRSILERIPPGEGQAASRALLLGRALAVQGEFAESLRVLATVPPEALTPSDRQILTETTEEVRVGEARALREAGRFAEALSLVEHLALDNDDAFLRAELIAAVRGQETGAAALAELALHPNAGAHVWLAWASAIPAAERVDVLERAKERFADHPDILRLLGRTQWGLGRAEVARATAAATLAILPRDEDAWFVLVDATAATRPRHELDAVLDQFEPRVADSPRLVIRMSEHLRSLARGPDDPLLWRALRWLDTMIPAEDVLVPRLLARTRLLAAAEQWSLALDAVSATLARERAPVEAFRLRAEILSWAGQHADSLTAYDAYLHLVPDDIAARRQQARVAGWAGNYDQARRLYADLQSAVPELAALSAERTAKDAFFSGRWQDARLAYARWLAIEPDSFDARFDLAETLRALGRSSEADQQLLRLGQSGHTLAADAVDRAAFNRRPSFAVTTTRADASGYQGLNLLDLREHGGAFSVRLGDRLSLTMGGAAVEALAANVRRSGSRAQVTGRTRLADRLTFEVRGDWWEFAGAAGSAGGRVQAGWQVADHWTLLAGVDRDRLHENLATIVQRLTATSAFAAVERQSPQSSLSLRVTSEQLSDGNRRQRAALAATRALGLRHLRGIVWIDHLAYRRAAADYFSPASFTRADVGLEYTFPFAAPRFRHDRRREITAAYLIGTDNRGERYQHPSMRLDLEVMRGLAIDVAAGAIRSDVYNNRSFSISWRLGAPVARPSDFP